MTQLNDSLLNLIFDISDHGMLVVDSDRRIVLWNIWMERASGVERAKAEGRTVEQVFPELSGTRLAKSIDNALERGLSSLLTPTLNRVLFPLKGGTRDREMEQIVMVKPVKGRAMANHAFIQVTDITEASHRERLLRQQARATQALAENHRLSEARMRAIVDNSLDAIITFDNECRVTTFNPAAERIFGFPSGNVLGRSVDRFIRLGDTLRMEQETDPVRLCHKLVMRGGVHEAGGERVDGSRIALEFTLGAMEMDERPVFVITARDVTLRKQTEARIQYLAHYDSLTQLPNRVLFHERLSQAFAQSRRTKMTFALMMLDLDFFKQVNDTLGHHVGDLLLKSVAERISHLIRETDTVARLGGDEFAILLTNLANREGASHVAQSVVESLGKPHNIEGHEVKAGASIGVAMFSNQGEDADEMLKRADLALYRSKAAGRSTWHFFSPELST